MVDDTYIDILGATCSDGDSDCADTDATWTRSSSIKGTAADRDYYMFTFLYDSANNGVGYTPLTKRLRIDNTIPTTSITSPAASSRQSGSFNVSFTDYDARS